MIKFRAWDNEQQIMRGIRGLFWTKNNLVAHCSPTGDKFDEFFTTILNDGEYHLMQSTGLKDLKGVEIYEGDIVQSTWYDVDNNPYKKKGEITFVGAQYVIVYDSQFDVETGEITYDAHSLTYTEDAEVIGIIYENP